MTLHIFDVEQRSEEWYAARRGIVTASVVSRLLTPTLKVADNETSRRLTTELAAERITGWSEDNAITSDMFRGIDAEPFARRIYSDHYAEATEVGFLRRDEDGWTLGFSPDGLVGDYGLIEIKAPRGKAHVATVLEDDVPDHYMAQLQAGLLVSGREWIDYVSFVGGMHLYVKRVYPSQDWHAAIEAACRKFEQDVTAMVAEYTARVEGLPKTNRVSFEIEVA